MPKPNISEMNEQEVVNLFVSTLSEFVDKFYEQVTKKYKPWVIKRGYALTARWAHIYGDCLMMDYSAIATGYTKEMAKTALNLFKEYSNIISLYCDALKFKYPNLEYYIGKAEVSSAKIGREIFIQNFPFKMPDGFYDKTDTDSAMAYPMSE